jgi:hypothetical protein
MAGLLACVTEGTGLLVCFTGVPGILFFAGVPGTLASSRETPEPLVFANEEARCLVRVNGV